MDGNRAPDGWWQRSLRGPRSPSEVWPRVKQFRQLGTPQPSTRGKGPDKVRCLEAALAALGAEDVAAKTEVEAALERAREAKKPALSNQEARSSPDAALEHEELSKEKEDGRPEVETHLQARRFVHSTDPAVEVQKVRVELMDMQKERDALKAALEAQRNCMDTSSPASPGTRMSALIHDAAKRRCLEGS